MLSKIAVFLCLVGLTLAGSLYGGHGYSLGSVGYPSYVAPAYSYSAHPVSYAAAPISYAAPIPYSSYAPVSYGYSSLGYGSKYLW